MIPFTSPRGHEVPDILEDIFSPLPTARLRRRSRHHCTGGALQRTEHHWHRMICLSPSVQRREERDRHRNITPYRRQSSGADSTSPANRQVRSGSLADIGKRIRDVRLPPEKRTCFASATDVRSVPCVDGSLLARAFRGDARLVGAAMCPAF